MTKRERAIKLCAMNEFICHECGEDIWDIWITYGCPDDDYETIEDYEIWVETEEEYKEMETLFYSLLNKKEKEKFIEHLKTLDKIN